MTLAQRPAVEMVPDDFEVDFAERLRRFQAFSGISSKRLARMVRISESHFYQYVRRERSPNWRVLVRFVMVARQIPGGLEVLLDVTGEQTPRLPGTEPPTRSQPAPQSAAPAASTGNGFALRGKVVGPALRAFTAALLLPALLLASFLPTQTAEASGHGFSKIIVNEVQAFRHVLEDNDRLYLVRYTLTEEPPTGHEAWGPSGAVLSLEDGAAVLSRQTPTATGYALEAFYQPALSASTWGATTLEVELGGNPTVFNPLPTPSTVNGGSSKWTWNATATRAETASAVGDKLKSMLRAIETDDPDISSNTLVNSSGITEQGAAIVDAAFPALQRVAPEAFITSQRQVAHDAVIPTPGAHSQEVARGIVYVTALTVDGAAGATSITVADAGGFGRGNPIIISATDQADHETVVAEVDTTAKVITIGDPLPATYAVASGAAAEKPSPLARDLKQAFAEFGFPPIAAGIILLGLSIGGIGFASAKAGGPGGAFVTLHHAGPVMVVLALLTLLSFPLVIALTAVVAVLGGFLFIKRVFID